MIEVDTSLGYVGDELKQFINAERMRVDREKEKEDERKRQEKQNERAEQGRVEKQRRLKRKRKGIELNARKKVNEPNVKRN